MSKTLNLIDILLTTGRHLFLMGRFTEALQPLTKLSGFRKLPDPADEELQSLLAEIYLQQKKYRDARRHLAVAMAMRPLNAEYCYLMAVAFDEDEEADRKRAEAFYARAVELEADQPTYWLDFGSFLFKIGKRKAALKAIRRAYTLGITDVEIVGEVAEVLRREAYADEATTKVRAALFHSHGCARFRQLWQQHQFALIHLRQQKSKPNEAERQSDRSVILPFVTGAHHGRFLELGAKTFRIDQAEPLDEPKKKEAIPFRRPPKKG
jgi:tetratricopeptide (TPR) repeat protein